MASIKSPQGGIGGMVSSPEGAADSMKKLAVVGISMILRQRFGIPDENFTPVPFGSGFGIYGTNVHLYTCTPVQPPGVFRCSV